MPYIGGYGISREWLRLRAARRKTYAAKLRALGIVENSNKWHSLMHRKGL